MIQHVNVTEAIPIDPNPILQTSAAPVDDVVGPNQRAPRIRVPVSWLRTLTARLVAGVVTLVVFLVVGTGSATYWYLHSFLLRQLDAQVSASAQRNAQQINACENQGLPSCSLEPTTNSYGRSSGQPRDFQKQWVVCD